MLKDMLHYSFSCDAFEIPECDPAKEQQYTEKCSRMNERDGPFANCIGIVDADVSL